MLSDEERQELRELPEVRETHKLFDKMRIDLEKLHGQLSSYKKSLCVVHAREGWVFANGPGIQFAAVWWLQKLGKCWLKADTPGRLFAFHSARI